MGRGETVWEKVVITMDSGAVDTVGPPSVAKNIPYKATEARRRSMKYKAANGTPIENWGEKIGGNG